MSAEASAPDANGSANSASQSAAAATSFKDHVLRDPSAAICCFARLVVIVCTFSTIVPVLASMPTSYKVALQASLLVFSIRLAERRRQKGVPVISRQFFSFVFTEDSGHYIFYSGFYYQYYPTTFILIPLVTYAIIQSAKYLNDAKQFFSVGLQSVVGTVHMKVASSQDVMYRFIAASEVFLMLIVTLNTLFLGGGLLAPFFHYFFLKWRYNSVRNKYVRVVCYELKMAARTIAQHPRCPQFVRRIIQWISG